jgi:hypothetical protein
MKQENAAAAKAQVTALVTEKPAAVETPEVKKSKVNILTRVLLGPAGKLTITARSVPGSKPTTLVTITDGTSKLKTRGCRSVHTTWEEAQRRAQELEAEAVKAGWNPPPPPKTRAGKTAPKDAFTAIPPASKPAAPVAPAKK